MPEGWNMEANSWIQGYGIPDRHLAAGANCTRTPFSGAPWQLPTKDTLLIGAEYFDGKRERECVLLSLLCGMLFVHGCASLVQQLLCATCSACTLSSTVSL